MKTLILSAALTSTLALTGAAHADKMMVKDIDVMTDMAAIENAKAAGVWKTVDGTLEEALLARLTDRISDKGAIITIDIDEVSLANNFEIANNLADSTLKGWVKIERTYDEKGEVVELPEELYELSVTALEAKAYYPEGTDMETVKVNSDVFYTAMIAAFADNVVEKLQ
ncbi:hypothetical protein N4R57_08770 [Rhodobacteraceae bacterium D3-12]|nr:hypothetical protein N4R57_08770 [Rhodobacteraceae bacterium D3-12]